MEWLEFILKFFPQNIDDGYKTAGGVVLCIILAFVINSFQNICEHSLLRSFKKRKWEEWKIRNKRDPRELVPENPYYKEAVAKYVNAYLKLIWHFPEHEEPNRIQELTQLLSRVAFEDVSMKKLESKFIKRTVPESRIRKITNRLFKRNIYKEYERSSKKY